MTPHPDKAARELLAFYLEAGVDTPVGEEAVDRFSDDTAPPGAEPAPVSQTATPPITPQRAAASALPLAAPPAPEAAALAAREAVKGISTLAALRTVLAALRG